MQIFGNVLHNAIKFTPQGGLIAVSRRAAGPNAVIRIRDTGCGIPQTDARANLRDASSKSTSRWAAAHGGLGIGLTLVKRLVELHEGTIVAHQRRLGERKRICHHAAGPLDGAAAGDAWRREPATPLRRRHARRRILVVDDACASAETLALLLRAVGHEVSTVHDGRSAVDWTLKNKPEIVFLDIAMPGMDGYEVARRIRDTAGLEEIVLVALTGYGQEEDRRRASEAGFNHHLTKPTSLAALNDVLSARARFPPWRELRCRRPASRVQALSKWFSDEPSGPFRRTAARLTSTSSVESSSPKSGINSAARGTHLPPVFFSIFAHVSRSETVRLKTRSPGRESFESAQK